MPFMHNGYEPSITVWKDPSFATLYARELRSSLFNIEKKVTLEMVYKGEQNSCLFHYEEPEN